MLHRRSFPASSVWRISALFLATFPLPGLAHSFIQVYSPPVPVWLYAWGASAALLMSFLVFAAFVRHDDSARTEERWWWLPGSQRAGLRRALKMTVAAFGLGLLLLSIATGLWGRPNPYGNWNLTFFWILFSLALVWICALVGNAFQWGNPWAALSELLARIWPAYGRGLMRQPQRLGYWPAFVLYLGFIYLELFSRHSPQNLAFILLAYSLLNLIAAGITGPRYWFRQGELFAVLFALMGRLAPLQWRLEPNRSAWQWRWGLNPASLHSAGDYGLILFILFMLASTAFDGLRDTLLWHQIFWVDLYHAGLKDWVGSNPLAAFPQMRELARDWDLFWLLASPWLYLTVYLVFLSLSKCLARSSLSLGELARAFALPLLPIALVYHLSHYYSLLYTQGFKIIALASDPFDWGWNLFGTANWFAGNPVPDADWHWHFQVSVIVLGHIASVYLSHLVALRLFANRRQALLSQIPMLGLMMAFTAVGLWVLSLPPAQGH